MNILLTGGLGFIGTSTALTLISDANHFVRLFDNQSVQVHGADAKIDQRLARCKNIEIVKGDVRNRKQLLDALTGIDSVVHLAAETGTAQSMYRVAHYADVNVMGTAVLVDLLANEKHSVKKIVLASSRSVYGEGAYRCSRDGVVYPLERSNESLLRAHWNPVCPFCGGTIAPIPTPEDAPARPASVYASTKYSQEHLVRIVCRALGIEPVILRFQNVYGTGQSLNNPYTGLLSIFSTRIRRGLPLPIYEDGMESRDFVHVSDVVCAIRLALERDEADGLTLNVGSGVGASVLEVVNMLVDALGGSRRPKVTGEFRLGDIRHCFADISRIQSRLGYVAKKQLRDGIGEFASWVLSEPIGEDRLGKANEELRMRKLMS